MPFPSSSESDDCATLRLFAEGRRSRVEDEGQGAIGGGRGGFSILSTFFLSTRFSVRSFSNSLRISANSLLP